MIAILKSSILSKPTIVLIITLFLTQLGSAQVNRPIGINYVAIEDWSEEFVFADIMK